MVPLSIWHCPRVVRLRVQNQAVGVSNFVIVRILHLDSLNFILSHFPIYLEHQGISGAGHDLPWMLLVGKWDSHQQIDGQRCLGQLLREVINKQQKEKQSHHHSLGYAWHRRSIFQFIATHNYWPSAFIQKARVLFINLLCGTLSKAKSKFKLLDRFVIHGIGTSWSYGCSGPLNQMCRGDFLSGSNDILEEFAWYTSQTHRSVIFWCAHCPLLKMGDTYANYLTWGNFPVVKECL